MPKPITGATILKFARAGGWENPRYATTFSPDDVEDLSNEPHSSDESPTTGPSPGADSKLFHDVADWAGRPVPERKWLVPDLIPMGQLTLFSGDGGCGKSQVSYQLAASVALGLDWIGLSVRSGRSLFFSAEDSEDELHRRLIAIAEAEGVTLEDFRGKLFVRSFVDANPLLAALHREKVLAPSDLYRRLRAAVRETKPDLLVLDTLGNLFPGNENDRTQVTLFIGFLKTIAIQEGCAVVVLAHPSRAGLATGSGDSGSTGWSNGVRSRLFLERVKSGGVEIDPNRRRLSQKKANYSQGGFEITLRWTRGVFVPLADTAGFAADLACAKFLELVDAYAAEQKPLNPRSGPSYAPKVFSEDPRSDGISKARFKAAMALLFDDGAIVEDAIVVNRKTRQTIVRAGKG